MNWLVEFFVLIGAGVIGMFAIRIPLLIVSPFQGNVVGNMYFQILVGFAVFAVFLFQAGRVVRKNISSPAREILHKNKKKVLLPLLGLAVFGILLPAGYITDDIRYGQCSILTTGQMGSGVSYSLFSSEQSCRQGCIISGNVGVSTDRTVQCNFDGLGYSWSATADSYSTIDKDSMKPRSQK